MLPDIAGMAFGVGSQRLLVMRQGYDQPGAHFQNPLTQVQGLPHDSSESFSNVPNVPVRSSTHLEGSGARWAVSMFRPSPPWRQLSGPTSDFL
jgi:hypothetical protein